MTGSFAQQMKMSGYGSSQTEETGEARPGTPSHDITADADDTEVGAEDEGGHVGGSRLKISDSFVCKVSGCCGRERGRLVHIYTNTVTNMNTQKHKDTRSSDQ